MDNQPTSLNQPPAPPQPAPAIKRKNNTPFIIIGLFFLASLLTGLAYIFLSPSEKPSPSQQQIAQIPTPTPKEIAKWQRYTNDKFQYSFVYPVTWTMTKISSDQKSFELHDQNTTDPAVITVHYLTDDERGALPPTFCEQSFDKYRCHYYGLTDTSEVLVDRITVKADSKVDAFVTLPKTGVLRIQITDTNATSYDTFAILVDTLKFPNEKRLYGLQLCPDTSVGGATVQYNGVTFETADLDTKWISENCK